ncbi:LAFE_0F12134g1_1 [Lachancea fermentati]|uniref:LAFE_0F12134g1_1 n=1 Tax=Lachancea fermentati TaxID=4955 RepID=A0A1G4MFN5_LACFM|nr:LAFE_0F12134g1_1 [Lachancea fermentati]
MASKFTRKSWCFKDSLSSSPVIKFNNAISLKMNETISTKGNYIGSGDHLLYFNPSFAELSSDGYFEYQTPSALLESSVPFLRRMWAMGSICFNSRLKLGLDYECVENIKFIKKIQGNYFVSVLREIRDQGSTSDKPLIKEIRTLIYCNSPHSQVESISKNLNYTYKIPISFSDLDIFRHCALTYNSHRIHWDLEYCQKVEGYHDIVTPGPLILHTLLKYVESELGLQIQSIQYKNTNCVYRGTELEMCVTQICDGHWLALITDAKDPNLAYFEASLRVS